jgi:GTP cyclohydrolase I
MAEIDHAKIEAAVRMILEGIGDDPDREGVVDTPRRVASRLRSAVPRKPEDPASNHFTATKGSRQRPNSDPKSPSSSRALTMLRKRAASAPSTSR